MRYQDQRNKKNLILDEYLPRLQISLKEKLPQSPTGILVSSFIFSRLTMRNDFLNLVGVSKKEIKRNSHSRLEARD